MEQSQLIAQSHLNNVTRLQLIVSFVILLYISTLLYVLSVFEIECNIHIDKIGIEGREDATILPVTDNNSNKHSS